MNEIAKFSSVNFLTSYIVITSINAFWFIRLLLYTVEAHTLHLPIAVPSCVVTVTEYSFETGLLALRKTMADPLFSDTLYTTGSKLTVIATENEEKTRKE